MRVDGRIILDVHEVRSEDDARAALMLAKRMYDEKRPAYVFSPEVVMSHLTRLLEDFERNEVNCWVAFDGLMPIGIAVAFVNRPFYSIEAFGSLNYWYVVPDYRHTAAALVLLRQFERWARNNGAVELLFGATDDHDPTLADTLNRMFERTSFNRVGAWYAKRTAKV